MCEYLDRNKDNGEKGGRAAVRSERLNKEGMRLVSAREQSCL